MWLNGLVYTPLKPRKVEYVTSLFLAPRKRGRRLAENDEKEEENVDAGVAAKRTKKDQQDETKDASEEQLEEAENERAAEGEEVEKESPQPSGSKRKSPNDLPIKKRGLRQTKLAVEEKRTKPADDDNDVDDNSPATEPAEARPNRRQG